MPYTRMGVLARPEPPALPSVVALVFPIVKALLTLYPHQATATLRQGELPFDTIHIQAPCISFDWYIENGQWEADVDGTSTGGYIRITTAGPETPNSIAKSIVLNTIEAIEGDIEYEEALHLHVPASPLNYVHFTPKGDEEYPAP